MRHGRAAAGTSGRGTAAGCSAKSGLEAAGSESKSRRTHQLPRQKRTPALAPPLLRSFRAAPLGGSRRSGTASHPQDGSRLPQVLSRRQPARAPGARRTPASRRHRFPPGGGPAGRAPAQRPPHGTCGSAAGRPAAAPARRGSLCPHLSAAAHLRPRGPKSIPGSRPRRAQRKVALNFLRAAPPAGLPASAGPHSPTHAPRPGRAAERERNHSPPGLRLNGPAAQHGCTWAGAGPARCRGDGRRRSRHRPEPGSPQHRAPLGAHRAGSRATAFPHASAGSRGPWTTRARGSEEAASPPAPAAPAAPPADRVLSASLPGFDAS
ncbi:basic salivary proline-rich protein 2-like [Strigops habroptila]|uniref:basic salivary proline-rich protein 2-like n=1 Tax=Strigops habroptila TaxID=2489341 RepID=UPI0011CF6A22|nr:basic salivary proline-rich protein 2-like [Strigops habroptila]